MVNETFWKTKYGKVVFALLLLLLVFSAAVLVWSIGPYVAMLIQRLLETSSDSCELSSAAECDRVFTRLGQTGDSFAVVSSVFSGLALLAVAATMWIERVSRRESRKPLIVCQLEHDDGLTFDEPTETSPRGIRLTLRFQVSALNDVALNIQLDVSLVAANWRKSLEKVSVEVPLAEGSYSTAGLQYRLNAEGIRHLVTTISSGDNFYIEVSSSCNSMEGLTWITNVQYKVSFRSADADKLRALNSTEPDAMSGWANGATVVAQTTVRPKSWVHHR